MANVALGLSVFEDLLRSMTLDFLARKRYKVSHAELFAADDAVVLDVRTQEETGSVCFPLRHQVGAVLQIPLHELPDRLREVPHDRPLGILCVSDTRSAIAFAYLRAQGYANARILAGGTRALVEELTTGKVMQHADRKDAKP